MRIDDLARDRQLNVLTVIVTAPIARRLEAITTGVVIPAVLVFAGAALIAMAG